MKFKAEISLLIVAIALFFASTFVYSSNGVALGYAYKSYAISLVGFGSVLMVAASVSYSKRNKKIHLTEV
jgi:hypothetical protein